MDINNLGVATVAALVVICYLIGMAVKASPIDSKWIPIICGVCGAILGALALACGMPEFPAADYFTAVAVGIMSGLTATGVNQVGKQLTKTEIDWKDKYERAAAELIAMQQELAMAAEEAELEE